jgi:hypothetical protein
MKKIFTLSCALVLSTAAFAQPIICSGNPLTGINGTTYDSVAGTGTNMHGSVANSKDGKLFSTNGGKVRYINTNNFSIMDSMALDINYFVGWQSNDTMFGLRTNGTLCRFNTATKALIDTLAIAGLYHSRVTERPMSKEVWISGAPIAVVDYTSTMTAGSTIALGTNIINVKFSSDGLIAYANSGVSKRIYEIDAVTKMVTDSVDFAPESPASFELSADNSKLFVTVTGKVRVYQTSNLALIDSMYVNMPITNLYRHPTTNEIWCVHHFADSVSVFNPTTLTLIDSMGVGGSPFFLAFGVASTGVKEIANASDVTIYPNPAQTAVTIELGAMDATVMLYDIKGALLQTVKAVNGKTVLTVAELPAGLYYIKATDARGQEHIAKFSKI